MGLHPLLLFLCRIRSLVGLDFSMVRLPCKGDPRAAKQASILLALLVAKFRDRLVRYGL